MQVDLNALSLRRELLGPFPIVSEFIERLRIPEILASHLDGTDPRTRLTSSRALGALLRSLVVDREPLYRQADAARAYHPSVLGLEEADVSRLNDDSIGRALDRLFTADRCAILSEIVAAAAKSFRLDCSQIHCDTTSIRFSGRYEQATGHRLRGQPTPWITYGYSRDHRPDLKQLLFILSISADGGVPLHFRCANGNTADTTVHIDTWNHLRAMTGRNDFLYVADSKLCTYDNLHHIATNNGRFVTVLPRNRSEDGHFREWIQSRPVTWDLVWDRPNPYRAHGPRDRWHVHLYQLPSAEGYRIWWIWSELLANKQRHTRADRIAGATQALSDLQSRLQGRATRLKTKHRVAEIVEEILDQFDVHRYLTVDIVPFQEPSFKQERRGRPNSKTRYVRIDRQRWRIEWSTRTDHLEYDQRTDGMYPLLTNDTALTGAQILAAHKGQPRIEKRFQQLKAVHEIAPVFLKNPGRIEALFTVYFLALLVQALIERTIRVEMKRRNLDSLAIYPEERRSAAPTTEQVLRLFSHCSRSTLMAGREIAKLFSDELTDIQKTVLDLLEIPALRYH